MRLSILTALDLSHPHRAEREFERLVRALHAHQLAIAGRPYATHQAAVWVELAAKPSPIRPGAG